jgi:hypothetical protein
MPTIIHYKGITWCIIAGSENNGVSALSWGIRLKIYMDFLLNLRFIGFFLQVGKNRYGQGLSGCDTINFPTSR